MPSNKMKNGSNVLYVNKKGNISSTTSSKYTRKDNRYYFINDEMLRNSSNDIILSADFDGDKKYEQYDYRITPRDTKQMEKMDTITTYNDAFDFLNNSYDPKYKKSDNVRISHDDIISRLNSSVGMLSSQSPTPHIGAVNKSIEYYNRYKLVNPDELLQKGFAHIFFVKPSCSIFRPNSTKMRRQFRTNPDFMYTNANYPHVVRELSTLPQCGDHDFSFLLSNHVKSISLHDDDMENGTYGQSWSGYKIAYGRHDLQSKAASEISIDFGDTRDLAVFQMLRLWEKYISGVYRGDFIPYPTNIINKILDYTGAIYYIITAEDGETIIYWSKYYGVFPTNVPVTNLAWSQGTVLSSDKTDITINFAYSFKENYNFSSLYEFNFNSRIENIGNNHDIKYAPTYVDTLGTADRFWVGRPFIDFITTDTGRITCKLRFVDDPAADNKSRNYYNRKDVMK